MKCTQGKEKRVSEKNTVEKMQKLFQERGRKALEMAREEISQEEMECKEVREALDYFMTQYWQDLARPTLLSLVCEAVGGDPDLTTPIAVSMILISGAMDIHDDIIDESKVKHKRSTIFGKFGKNIALLAGDALMFKGLLLLNQSLENTPRDKRRAIINTIREMFFQLGDAEALELKFRRRLDVTPEEYVRIVEKKAADVEAHTSIGAILGGGTKEEIETLGRYGRLLGMMIILGDDVMDSWDIDELRHRIRKEHLPLPLLFALQNPKTKNTVTFLLSKREIIEQDLQTLIEIAREDSKTMKLLKEITVRAQSHLSHVMRCREDLQMFATLTGNVL
jgi:geranylgeranyl diphosphate synthase type I